MKIQTESYKGYYGKFEADLEAGTFNGTVAGIRDIVHFTGNTRGETLQAFKDSVDDYLEWAKEDSFEPQVQGE